jgi:hypothetical protein
MEQSRFGSGAATELRMRRDIRQSSSTAAFRNCRRNRRSICQPGNHHARTTRMAHRHKETEREWHRPPGRPDLWTSGGACIANRRRQCSRKKKCHTVVGVGVAGAPGVDVVAGLDLRPLHPVRQQPHLVSAGVPSRVPNPAAAAASFFFFFFCKSGHRANETREPALCCHSHGEATLLDASEKVSRSRESVAR